MRLKYSEVSWAAMPVGGLGGLASILGGLAGGSPKPAAPTGGGGIGAILGGLARQQRQAPPQQQQQGGGLGSILGGLLGGEKAPEPLPEPPDQTTQDHATILIRAMINAAKADGQIDAQEQEAIVGKLGGDLDASERAFVQRELQSPLDVKAFAASVPRELAQHAYAFSLMGIKPAMRSTASSARRKSTAKSPRPTLHSLLQASRTTGVHKGARFFLSIRFQPLDRVYSRGAIM